MKRKQAKTKPFFDPDEIVTTIHQALWRDFIEAQHVYCLDDSRVLYGFNRQVEEFRKKYTSANGDYDKDQLELAAFDKFKAVNDHMGRVNSMLSDKLVYSHAGGWLVGRSYEEKVHLRARALVRFVLGHFSWEEWFTECMHSGGSSIGVPFTDTSIQKKNTLPMSATESAESVMSHYLNDFDYQMKSAIIRNNYDDNSTSETYVEWFETTNASRATTVEKTDEQRRFICVEPTANMFLQQGLMHMMYKRLKFVGLDVARLPDAHKFLARIGSITGQKSTIDWSSASDTCATELVNWLLSDDWLEAIHKVRTPSTVIGGEEIELNMISSMGNATTFPLETLIFWAYATSVWLTIEGKSNSIFPEWEDLQRCSVFGDDCIVPTSIAEEYISFMEGIGFIVNKEKSYYGSEQFRESCGGDYLDGHDVRPYCVRAPHNTKKSSLEPWLYIVANSLLKKYKMYFGELAYVYEKSLWKVLFKLFRKYHIVIKLVPSDYPDDSGLKLSHDIERFRNHYPMKLSRIDKSEHGTYRFRYCRFTYKINRRRDDGLTYVKWLKKAGSPYVEPRLYTPIRRIGGYVVGVGLSSHWDVPVVKQGA